MVRLSKKIEDMMSAVSFAEEGEFDTARQMLKEERRVLLAVNEGRVERRTLRYALNTCKRIGADLDVLYISKDGSGDISDPVMKTLFADMEKDGIRCEMIIRNGCMKQLVIDRTRERKDILFVVIESAEAVDMECGKDKRLSDSWDNLQCPLVMVGV
ncbi:MAG: universal stress protein [Nitrospirae bacterium]|nr:universal stress protein [Nitrospirota bacterium]MCL5976866.1 universal stress protein [Nitrospirota bacterium]